MYPPPPKEIIRRLMQSDLDMVCHCRYVITLTFENGNWLGFEAPFRFARKEALSEAPIQEFLLSESNLIRVLGCSVKEVECESDGTLKLEFSNGDVLVVYANDPNYEAYTLKIDGKEYLV